jgi:transposase
MLEKKLNELEEENKTNRNEAAKFQDNEFKKLTDENSRLVDLVAKLEENLRRYQRDISHMQIHSETVEANLRKSFQSNLDKYANRSADLEIILASKDNEIQSLMAQLQKLNETFSIEVHVLQNEIKRLLRDKNVLMDSHPKNDKGFGNINVTKSLD